MPEPQPNKATGGYVPPPGVYIPQSCHQGSGESANLQVFAVTANASHVSLDPASTNDAIADITDRPLAAHFAEVNPASFSEDQSRPSTQQSQPNPVFDHLTSSISNFTKYQARFPSRSTNSGFSKKIPFTPYKRAYYKKAASDNSGALKRVPIHPESFFKKEAQPWKPYDQFGYFKWPSSLPDSSKKTEPTPIDRNYSAMALATTEMTVIKVSEFRQSFENKIAPLHRPGFLSDADFRAAATNDEAWKAVLDKMSEATFVLANLPDTEYFRAILACKELPHLWLAITKVSFPQFFWFSGIKLNRTVNPYLEVISHLPNLQELSLTFHTGGLTTSIHKERERIALEKQQLIEQSKQLKPLSVTEVVSHYELATIFKFRGITVLNLECLDSELTRHYCKFGDPLTPFYDLETYFKDGFTNLNGQTVEVSLKVTDAPLRRE